MCVLVSKKKIKFSSLSEIKKLNSGVLIGPGASGKTTLISTIYDKPVEFKGPDIVKNNVFNTDGKSLKFGSNVNGPSKEFPFIYIAPNFKSQGGYKPNISAWIKVLKENKWNAIVCYVTPEIHKKRIENRLLNKPTANQRQHLDNYPFSYTDLIFELERSKINYLVYNTGE